MKVLLVDDHPLILRALQAAIRGLGTDVSVHTAADSEQALAQLQQGGDFDLALIDLDLGEEDGFALLTQLRSLYPGLPVVVVSATEAHTDVIRAIDHGAMGFVSKRASNRELFDALRLVMSGGVYVPPTLFGLSPAPPDGDTVPAVMAATSTDRAALAPALPPAAAGGLDALSLTARQADVLALLLKGMSNKLIARELSLSVETVKDHVAAVLRALNVSSRTQAVLAVSQMSQDQRGAAWTNSSPR
jgi:DNA-binding NarL/FixJ family response regulator